MNAIVAVDRNWGIGKNNDLLFSIPEDLKNFRNLTFGKNVICGRKTLISFPGQKPLPGRRHFVLTHSDLEESENLTVVHSLDELFSKIREIPEDDVFVIGGESIYRQLLPCCKKVFVTKIFASDPAADVFFPDLDRESAFRVASAGEETLSRNGLKFAYFVYENQNL